MAGVISVCPCVRKPPHEYSVRPSSESSASAARGRCPCFRLPSACTRRSGSRWWPWATSGRRTSTMSNGSAHRMVTRSGALPRTARLANIALDSANQVTHFGVSAMPEVMGRQCGRRCSV